MLIYDDIRFKLNNMKPKLSDLRQALDLDKGQEEIAALEKRARAEKQPKKKFELVQQIKKFNLNSAVG